MFFYLSVSKSTFESVSKSTPHYVDLRQAVSTKIDRKVGSDVNSKNLDGR